MSDALDLRDGGGASRELLNALTGGWLSDPFALLGPHPHGDARLVRSYQPGATAVTALDAQGRPLAELVESRTPGLFVGRIAADVAYRLRIDWPGGVQETEDPYSFGLLLGELDMHLLCEGRHLQLSQCLGARPMSIGGTAGVRFAVWAPNARRVSVVGDFNNWDGRRHPMRKRMESGVWELFVPRLQPGMHYKYELLGSHGLLPLKADPCAWQAERAPNTGSVIADTRPMVWNDHQWMNDRAARHRPDAPMSVYELHAESWQFGADGQRLGWAELAERLIPYVRQMGFTHIELLPIMTHPFGGSWGYQPLGLFAPQASLGTPTDFAAFVNRCHEHQIGVILDWVPAHFPADEHGLAQFDGTALYEHADPREGFHQDWNTLIYNFGRHEVRSFLLSSALHWLQHYHVDGLRVDAVASMLYRDYSRKAGEWVPNRYGGRENLEAIDFLRDLNTLVGEYCPGAITIAEESTAWPGVTRPVHTGGLGFWFKWNMGWMNDTLRYIEKDPIHRGYDHNLITFSLVYAFSENYMLPLSHDEVVHGKKSLIQKMPGDGWQQFANLRAYYAFMWSHPGKKLLFMGCEIAQWAEWNHDSPLDWPALDNPRHRGVQQLIADLNRLYRSTPALHRRDCEPDGFTWIAGDDNRNSVLVFCRRGGADHPPVVVACNFTPVPREAYRIGVPQAGAWREMLNTDAECYGGSNLGNGGGLVASAEPSHGMPCSMSLTLPPLATVWLTPV